MFFFGENMHVWWLSFCVFFIRNCSCPSICFLQIPQGSDKAESVDQMEILFRGLLVAVF